MHTTIIPQHPYEQTRSALPTAFVTGDKLGVDITSIW